MRAYKYFIELAQYLSAKCNKGPWYISTETLRNTLERPAQTFIYVRFTRNLPSRQAFNMISRRLLTSVSFQHEDAAMEAWLPTQKGLFTQTYPSFRHKLLSHKVLGFSLAWELISHPRQPWSPIFFCSDALLALRMLDQVKCLKLLKMNQNLPAANYKPLIWHWAVEANMLSKHGIHGGFLFKFGAKT